LTIFIAILLGIVQGLTEFLPVSSSGHLVLLGQVFYLHENNLLFCIILHLATLFAVLFVFKNSVIQAVKHPFSKKSKMLIFATCITLILAFLFEDFFQNSFSGGYLAASFFVTALFLLFAEWVSKQNKNPKQLNYKNTAVMGLFQGFAILPGISRSGATLSSAVVQGINKKDAAEFSFLMSIPIILASLIWELLKLDTSSVNIELMPTLFGFVFALLFGVFAIKIMLKVIEKAKYHYFSIYLFVLGLFLVLNSTVFRWF
jgi:undecaprenyl-diphosphatase